MRKFSKELVRVLRAATERLAVVAARRAEKREYKRELLRDSGKKNGVSFGHWRPLEALGLSTSYCTVS